MDSTAENFRVYLPVMKEQLAGAAFVAIDEEMTGITDRQNPTIPSRRRSQIFGVALQGAVEGAIKPTLHKQQIEKRLRPTSGFFDATSSLNINRNPTSPSNSDTTFA